MHLFIGDLVKVVNYKPLETATKLEKLFSEEFDRISFYNLMLYSELTKDLLVVFKDRDVPIIKAERDPVKEESSESGDAGQEEEKSEEAPAKAIDPSKLAAQMLKAQAA